MSRRLALIALCLAIFGCKVEEARLRVTNPLALSSLVHAESRDIRTVSLVIYPNGDADLIVDKTVGGTDRLRGRIDMLGAKADYSYPLRFDYLTNGARVHFLQKNLSSEIEILREEDS